MCVTAFIGQKLRAAAGHYYYKCAAQETEYHVTSGHPDPNYCPCYAFDATKQLDWTTVTVVAMGAIKGDLRAVFVLKCADLSDFNVQKMDFNKGVLRAGKIPDR